MLALARALRHGKDWKDIRGLSYISREPREDYLNLPSHAECLESKDTFTEAFHQFYFNCDPITAKGLCQKCDDRYLIQNPPSMTYTEEEMDAIYSMEFARDVHPYYKAMGAVRALDTIRYSVTTHRGCYGECNFVPSLFIKEERSCREVSLPLWRKWEKLQNFLSLREIFLM